MRCWYLSHRSEVSDVPAFLLVLENLDISSLCQELFIEGIGDNLSDRVIGFPIFEHFSMFKSNFFITVSVRVLPAHSVGGDPWKVHTIDSARHFEVPSTGSVVLPPVTLGRA